MNFFKKKNTPAGPGQPSHPGGSVKPPISPPKNPPPKKITQKEAEHMALTIKQQQLYLDRAEEIVDGIEHQNTVLQTQTEKLQQQLMDQETVVVMIPLKATKFAEWRELKGYMVSLAHPTHFTDSPDAEFDRVFMVCRRDFEQEFLFSSVSLYLIEDSIDIIGQTAGAWFARIGMLPDGIPMLFSTYTERDMTQFLDAAIDAKSINDLKVEVLTRLYLAMKNKFEKYADMIEQAEFMAEMDHEARERLLRKFRTRLTLMDNDTQATFTAKGEQRLPKWQVALLGAGWFIALFLSFFVKFK